MATSPLGEARAAYGKVAALAPDLEQALFGAETARSKFAEAQGAAVVGSAIATATSAKMGAEILAREQEAHTQLLQAVGLDINDPASALNQELRREQETRTQREALDKEIAARESVSFFQNPFQFLAVQPELQQMTAQYNVLARTENRATSEVARMQSLATTIKTLTPAKSADLIRARAEQDAIAVVKQAEATANQISAQNAAGYAKTLLDTYTLRRNTFSDILGITNAEEAIADRRQRAADSNFWRAVKMDELREKNDEKRALANQQVAIVTGINLYRKAIAGQSAGEWTLEDVKRMPASLREKWMEVVLRGNYGNDYSQSVPFIATYGNVADAANSGNAAMMSQVRMLQNKALELRPTIKNEYRTKNMGKDMKDEDALEMAYQTLYNQDRMLAMKGSDKSVMPPTSPYALDYEALAKQAAASKTPGLIGGILVEAKARKPGENLTQTMTARSLLQETEARVVAGKADPKTAAEELSRFYALSTAQNYEAAGLKYFGLPQMTDYTITPGASGKTKVDLMNPTQVENYLTSQAAAAKRANRIGTNNPIFPWR